MMILRFASTRVDKAARHKVAESSEGTRLQAALGIAAGVHFPDQ